MTDKPAFDPGQPFQVVDDSGGKPPFDPSKPFQAAPAQPPESRMQRIGHGAADPFYGAAQIGARMPEQEGESLGYAIMGGESPEARRVARQQTVDKAVVEREKAIQAQRPAEERGKMDWYRAAGSVPTTALVTAPALAVGGPIVGGAIMGAMGALVQPETDIKDFGTKKAKEAVSGAVGGAVLGGVAKMAGAGLRAFGSYLAREYPENVAVQAVNTVLKRFKENEKSGGLTAQQAIQVVNEANDRGTPLNLADVGPEGVRMLGGHVARQPGEGRNIAEAALNPRDRGAASRLDADINAYVHGGDSMFRTTRAMIEQRSAEGKPLWEQVRQMQGVWSPRLQEFIEDPVIKRGMARGYEIERLESLAEGRPFDPTQLGVDLDQEGNILIRQAPNMRVLHMGKMGLDAMIADERNEITGRLSQRGVALDKVRRAYLKEIDSLDRSGIYRAARSAWEGPSASMDAIRAGHGAFSSTPEEIAHELSQLSPANQEFYRIGVADKIREKLMRTGVSGDEAKQLVRNNWMREQLRPVFRSDADFDNFMQSVAWEQEMFGTVRKTLGGSETAARFAEDTSAENLLAATGKLGMEAVKGSVFGSIKAGYNLWRDLGLRPNPKLNEEMAKILFGGRIDPNSALYQRMIGRGSGPRNPLAGVASAIDLSAGPLAAGKSSVFNQPGPSP